jgi:hypothetical protein
MGARKYQIYFELHEKQIWYFQALMYFFVYYIKDSL